MDQHPYIHIYCTSCGRWFNVPRPCHDRFCETCSTTRKRKVRSKLTWIVSHLPYIPGQKVRHIVLTIPNQQDLRNAHSLLVRSFRRLRQRKWFDTRVSGGAFTIEVTGQPGSWHVHLHVLAQCRFLDVYRLSEIWSTCSTGRIVYVKNTPVGTAINYVTAYLGKSGAPAAYHSQVSGAFKGLRLYNIFGSWHAVNQSCPTYKYICPCCGGGDFISNHTLNWWSYCMSKYGMVVKHTRASPTSSTWFDQ